MQKLEAQITELKHQGADTSQMNSQLRALKKQIAEQKENIGRQSEDIKAGSRQAIKLNE